MPCQNALFNTQDHLQESYLRLFLLRRHVVELRKNNIAEILVRDEMLDVLKLIVLHLVDEFRFS